MNALIAWLSRVFNWDTEPIQPIVPPTHSSINNNLATSTPTVINSPVSTEPIITKPMTTNPDSIVYAWDTPAHIYHNVRVLCDLAELTLEEKNIICACIYQESRFNNNAKCYNKNSAGVTLSIDWGICQINDYYHIAPTGSPFASVAYVLANPKEVVEYMITMYKNGALKQWVSYSSDAYLQWLVSTSPMWKLSQG
jgi:hypothetical protein